MYIRVHTVTYLLDEDDSACMQALSAGASAGPRKVQVQVFIGMVTRPNLHGKHAHFKVCGCVGGASNKNNINYKMSNPACF